MNRRRFLFSAAAGLFVPSAFAITRSQLVAITAAKPKPVVTSSPPVGGGITRIGDLVEIQKATNSGTQSISVPADAELMVIGVTGWEGTTNYFSAGALTINGAAFTAIASDVSTSYNMGALTYKVSPSTGTQTLAWDWAGSTDPGQGVILVCGFYKGIDTASTVRDSHGGTQAAASSFVSKTLTAASGDMIIAFGQLYFTSSTTFTWTNATKISDFDIASGYRSVCATWAEGSPSGNTTVTVANNQSGQDGSIMSMVVKPA